MKPFDALDARLYLAVNRLPRNRWLNGFFYLFTLVFTAGIGWYVIMALALLVTLPALMAAAPAVIPGPLATLIEGATSLFGGMP